MSIGTYVIILAFVLRMGGRFIPFYAFRERMLISRLLPIAMLSILLSTHLVHSHFTLTGMYVMAQMFPEFVLLLLLAVVYVVVVSYRVVRNYLITRRFYSAVLEGSEKEGDLYVLPTDELIALNVGFFKPRVVVSRGVLSLPPRERTLVMEHERFHARMRDNLRLLLFELLLPSDRDREDYRSYLEIRNDTHLLGRYSPRDIAYTLVKFSLAYPGATGMATSLKRRIEFLAGEGRLLDLKVLRAVALLVLPLVWYLSYVGCYMDLCTK